MFNRKKIKKLEKEIEALKLSTSLSKEKIKYLLETVEQIKRIMLYSVKDSVGFYNVDETHYYPFGFDHGLENDYYVYLYKDNIEYKINGLNFKSKKPSFNLNNSKEINIIKVIDKYRNCKNEMIVDRYLIDLDNATFIKEGSFLKI